MNERASRDKLLLLAPLTAILCGLSAVGGYLLSRGRAEVVCQPAKAEERAPSSAPRPAQRRRQNGVERNALVDRPLVSRVATNEEPPDDRRPPREQAAKTVIKDIRHLAQVRADGNPLEPVEVRLNHMEGHLLGMLTTIRAIDPSLVDTLRDQFESDLCGGVQPTDIDLMAFAKLGSLQRSLVSPRALDCALTGRETEDVVLWSLLDAWRIAGQPPLPSLASIESNATDQRTLRRLAPVDAPTAGAPLPPSDSTPGAAETNGHSPIATRPTPQSVVRKRGRPYER